MPSISRRNLLRTATAGSFLSIAGTAPANAETTPADWRTEMVRIHLPESAGTSFHIKELLSGPSSHLELWELEPSGYMLADARHRIMLECSSTAPSPLRNFASNNAAYLGLGEYVVETRGSRFINALSGAPRTPLSNSRTGEAVDEIVTQAQSESPLSSSPPNHSKSLEVPPPVGSNARFRIPKYGYITGCTVLHNTPSEGRCGWIAATIVMRYWHARSRVTLIPAAHRTGNNIKPVSGADFADLIRSGKSMASWGKPVAEALAAHATHRMGVASQAWYNWLSTNVDSALNQGRPVILFGRLPDAYKDGRTIDHAVVAYGKSKDGHNIVHYTYNGRQSVILNSGLVGSNTHFLLR